MSVYYTNDFNAVQDISKYGWMPKKHQDMPPYDKPFELFSEVCDVLQCIFS